MPAETVEAPRATEGKQGEEPVAGAAAAPSPVPSEPAPTPAPAEGEKVADKATEGAQGAEGEQQPSAEDDGLPELTEEQLAKLYQRYGDSMLKLPDAQERVQQTAQELARQQAIESAVDPFEDETFREIVREYEGHGKQLAEQLPAVADLVKRISDGEDVDPVTLGQTVEKAVTAAARQRDLALAASDQRAVSMIDGVVNVLWSGEAETPVGRGRDGKPIALTNAWESVLAGYDTLRKSEDPETRAKAAGWFAQTALPIIYNLGVAKGVEHGRQQATKAQAPKLQAERDGALAEAMAKLGASHPAAPAGGGETRSDNELLLDPTTPVSKLQEIRRRQERGG